MLAADHRLRDSTAFRRTVRSGRRAGSASLVAHLLVDPAGAAQPQVGFVVSRAVGNSVQRNRVKRRLRHIVRDYLSDLPKSSKLVVRALAPTAAMDSAELRVELGRCLERVRRDAAPSTRDAAASRTGAAS